MTFDIHLFVYVFFSSSQFDNFILKIWQPEAKESLFAFHPSNAWRHFNASSSSRTVDSQLENVPPKIGHAEKLFS